MRRDLADEFPHPAIASAQVPTTGSILVDFMAADFPKKQDEQLSKIQASVIASCSPIANLWSDLDAQEMKGARLELSPADVLLRSIQATLNPYWKCNQLYFHTRKGQHHKSITQVQRKSGKDLKAGDETRFNRPGRVFVWQQCHG